MEPPLEVLVLPGGTELGLEVRQALGAAPGVRLTSAGQPGSSHAPFAFERHAVLPSVHTQGWLPQLREYVERHRIDTVYPTHDDVLLALAEHAVELGAGLVASPLETCRTARSKRATYAQLAGVVPVPALAADLEAPARFPVFVKPDRGQGSRDARIARDVSELAHALAAAEDPLVAEYLPGREFTVDCFSDREQGLLFTGGRERLRTRSGIACHTATRTDPRFEEYATHIGARLAFHGAWFFQVREDSAGELVLLEVAPRIAGGSGLQRARGVNLPLLALREQRRLPIEIHAEPWEVELGRALDSRARIELELDELHVALENTLVRDGRLHTLLVAFLLEAGERGVRLVLRTDDTDSAALVLGQHRLPTLFDAVRLHGDPIDFSQPLDGDEPALRTLLIDDDVTRRAAAGPGLSTLDSSVAAALLDGRR